MQYRRLLTIAGSDSSGGAGIQADLKTFAALGCYGMSVITAVTAQNTLGVSEVYPLPKRAIGNQLTAVLTDIGADAVKIGMLFSSEIIASVAEVLTQFDLGKIILDPVMIAQSGAPLLREDAVAAMKSLLFPLCMLVTPNLPEAEALSGRPIKTLEEMKSAAKEIAGLGPTHVLLKGGHSIRHAGTDVLYLSTANDFLILESPPIATRNNHGTGCTLSSAVAAHLAKGLSVEAAVRSAKTYISKAIGAGAAYKIGHGHGPVHHFFDYWT